MNNRNRNPDGIELPLTGERNQCRGCTEYFNSNFSFDLHRRSGKCLTRSEMIKRGMAMTDAGYWASGLMDSNIVKLRTSECREDQGESGPFAG